MYTAHRSIVVSLMGWCEQRSLVYNMSLSFSSSCYSRAMMHLEKILAIYVLVMRDGVCCACVSSFSTAPAQRSQKVYMYNYCARYQRL